MSAVDGALRQPHSLRCARLQIPHSKYVKGRHRPLHALEHQFAELAGKTENQKMIQVVQKTWKKMTPEAQARALELDYLPEHRALLDQALSPPR